MSWQKFEQYVEDLHHKVHDWGSDTFKLALTLTAPDPVGDAVYGDLTPITAGNGYTAGGSSLTRSSSGQTDGIHRTFFDDLTFTPTGSGFGPFRYAVVYNDTASGDPLCFYFDFGVSRVALAGTPLVLSLDQTNGFVVGQ